MSRFADPTAVDTFEVECPCPGAPHEHDTITHRTELGSGEVESAGAFGWQRGLALTGTAFYDSAAGLSMLIRIAVIRWSFTGADGGPLDISVRAADLLPDAIRDALRVRVSEAQDWEAGLAPKASAAPSPRGTRANASPTRTTRKRR